MVAVYAGVTERDIRGALGRLAQHSLLEATSTTTCLQYRTLETVRQFGIEQLRARGDITAQEAAESELQAARQAKSDLVHGMYCEIAGHTRRIVDNAERLLETYPHGEKFDETKAVEQSGKNVLAIVDMLLEHEKPGSGGSGS